jgi:hypothetical protein
MSKIYILDLSMPKMGVNKEENYSIEPYKNQNKKIYIALLDVDISLHKMCLRNSGLFNVNLCVPFSDNIETAKKYGDKLVKTALEKGCTHSIVFPNKTSFPVLGYVIITAEFNSNPYIKKIGSSSEDPDRARLSRKQVEEIITNPPITNITSYVPDWTPDKQRRFLLHKSGFDKLDLCKVEFIRCPDIKIDTHNAFCLYNSHNRLCCRDIHLLKEILDNPDGKSFIKLEDAKPSDAKPSDAKPSDAKPSDDTVHTYKPADYKPEDLIKTGGKNKDPYYKKYLQLKKIYCMHKQS